MTEQPTQQKPRLVVLVSGSGSNLQAIIDACQNQEVPGEIAAVIANRPDCKGLERAAAAGIPAIDIDHTAFESREAFDKELARCIDGYSPDLVVLAGFMRILTDDFVAQYTGRLLNIHPSLLPSYPGLNTHQRAIEAGDQYAGATVHFVTRELDGGPSVIRARVALQKDDTADALAARVLEKEHRIYPLAVQWFCEGRLKLAGSQVLLDDKPLPETGVLLWETSKEK